MEENILGHTLQLTPAFVRVLNKSMKHGIKRYAHFGAKQVHARDFMRSPIAVLTVPVWEFPGFISSLSTFLFSFRFDSPQLFMEQLGRFLEWELEGLPNLK